MINIAWTTRAGEDRDEAFKDAFILGNDEAEALLDALEQAEYFLLRTPFAGPTVFDNGRRKWRLSHLPYALIYRVETERLVILRLIHLRSDWQAMP